MADTPLPKDWDRILERFAATLAGVEQALAKVTSLDSRPEAASAYQTLLAEHAPKVDELGSKAAAVAQWAEAIDAELHVSEDVLRVLLAQTETVRHKLAAWTGR